MDLHIRTSLTENGLVECINLLEKESIHTFNEMQRLKISALCKILVEDELIDLFDDWRTNYQEPRTPLFFERLNTDPSLHHLSVVVRVDINKANPVICAVEPVFMEHLMAASREYVPMISLIGSTGTGKSFLTSSFMAEGSDSTRWPTVAEVDQTVPTTSHVCVYQGNLRIGSRRSVNLLDLEGESGSTPKTLVRNLAGMAQAAAISLVESASGMTHFLHSSTTNRGRIIKHTMPRMAYLLSDVVIFVDTIELRREEFKDRVKSFALEAHKSCNSVGWRPALIIISNRWSPLTADLSGIDQTSSYGDIVQALSPSLFSRVALMRIPSVNASQLNCDFVSQCIDKLHEKVNEFVSHVQQIRELHKCLYSEKKTWYLLREVVKWVHRDPFGDKPIKSLAELYDNDEQRSSVGNCLKALDMYGDHLDNSSLFHRNVSDVLRWYAYLAACDRKLGVQGEVDPADVCRAVLERCYAVEQCAATYTAPDGTVYHCRQHCQGHEVFHSNPAVVRVPSQNILLRFFGGTEAVPVRWAGRFQGARKPKEHSKEYFLEQMDYFENFGGDVLVNGFCEFQPKDLGSKAIDFNFCGLCLTQHDGNVTSLSNCHHVLCEVCVEKRKQLYPLTTYPPACVCPFCRVESPCPIFQPEEFVGFRVLSLDGGGVKGLIQVMVLQKIEAFFHPLKITNLFDVIVGTSAGGIIAMALQKNISLKRIAEYLEQMAENVPDVNELVIMYRLVTNQPICDTYTLEHSMKEFFGSNFNIAHNHNLLKPPYIFCTAFDVMATQTVLLGSRRALNQVATPEDLIRAQVGRVFSAELWEAARATSAAPHYFTPFYLSKQYSSARVLIDGGIGADCPAHLAMRVAKVLQRPRRNAFTFNAMIDVCLSLGTGQHVPNLAVHSTNGLSWAGRFIDIALDSERQWNEKCVESTEFAAVKDRIRINPPNLGSLNAFASSSIPQIHSGMDDYFKSPDAVRQMDILFHTMYAKLWHVRLVSNPVVPTPYKFNVSLRDLRLDLDGLDDAVLREVITSRGGVAPPAEAANDHLVIAAREALVRKPVVADLAGHFGCTMNGVEYESSNRVFEIPTADLCPGAFWADVFWQTEAGYRISLSGFPTFWEVQAGPFKQYK